MSKFSAINIRNKNQFRNEKDLYVVVPIVQYSVSWRDIADVTDVNKAIILHFEELKGKELYAKYTRVGEESLWKTYIVDHDYVNIVYLPTFALNTVGKKM